MKRIFALAAMLGILASTIFPDTLINQTITLSSTPVRVTKISTLASSIMVEMNPGSTSTGYVLFANPSVACSTSTTSQIAATLGPGTTTSPGSVYTYPTAAPNGGQVIDVSWLCVAGVSPDTATVSYSKR